MSPVSKVVPQPLGWDQPVNRRVLRGGSWCGPSRLLRAAGRGWCRPGFWSFGCGFRVVLEVR